jgi:hypothetical protein
MFAVESVDTVAVQTAAGGGIVLGCVPVTEKVAAVISAVISVKGRFGASGDDNVGEPVTESVISTPGKP